MCRREPSLRCNCLKARTYPQKCTRGRNFWTHTMQACSEDLPLAGETGGKLFTRPFLPALGFLITGTEDFNV